MRREKKGWSLMERGKGEGGWKERKGREEMEGKRWKGRDGS